MLTDVPFRKKIQKQNVKYPTIGESGATGIPGFFYNVTPVCIILQLLFTERKYLIAVSKVGKLPKWVAIERGFSAI